MFSKTGSFLFYASILLTIVAASLITVTFKQETFAKATISDGPYECTVAKIGVFSSSYMPGCLKALNNSLQSLPGKPLDSVPTRTLWPLFPAQNEFGKVDKLREVGLGWTEFTTCEQYMPLQLQNLSEVSTAPLLQMLGSLNSTLPEVVIGGFENFNDQITSGGIGNALLGATMYYVGFDQTNLLDTNWTQVEEKLQNENKILTRLAEFINSTCVQASPPISSPSVCQNTIVPLILVPMNSTSSRTFDSSLGSVYSGGLQDFYLDLLNVLTNFPPFKAIVEAQEALFAQLTSAIAMIVSCSNPGNENESWSQNALACSPGAYIPPYLNDHWVLTPVISGKLESGTLLDAFQSMLEPSFNASAVPAEFAQVIAAAPLVASCAITAPKESGTIACLESRVAVVAGTVVFNSLYSQLKWQATNLAPAAFTKAIVNECLDSDKNLEAITNGQSLVIGSMVVAWLAPVVAAVLFGVVKCRGSFTLRVRQGVLAFAGCLAIAAGILITIALVGIYNAPIYATLGVACEAGKTCYMTSSGAIMAMAALVLDFVGGVLILVSLFLAKGNQTSDSGARAEIKSGHFDPAN